jgi:hypothetical protein
MGSIGDEFNRIENATRLMLSQSSFVAEIPIRIHERELDTGGVMEWHHEFEQFLQAAGVCFCELGNPEWRDHEGKTWLERFGNNHICDRDERQARFRASRRQANPRRLKSALRHLRRISPAAFDIIFPIIARGQSHYEVITRVNDGRELRGQVPYSPRDYTVHWYAGLDLLNAIY